MQDQYTPDTIEIPLSSIRRRKYHGTVALIDASDLPLVAPYTWEAYKQGSTLYARAKDEHGVYIHMHRLILGVTDPKVLVDHANRNGIDNRRSNIRVATRQQNAFNAGPRKGASQYKGVSYFPRGNKWVAKINRDRKQYHLGYFENEIDAALAYDTAARELHGDFAYLNFPKGAAAATGSSRISTRD